MLDLTSVLQAFPPLRDDPMQPPVEAQYLSTQPLAGGLINDTYALGQNHILQRLHKIFSAEVNDDIAALTAPLREAGVNVPTLVLARNGKTYTTVTTEDPRLAGVWRIMNRLAGTTRHRLVNLDQARSAGQLIARFHNALSGIRHKFAFTRRGAHDTDLHLANLRRAVAAHQQHPHIGNVTDYMHELAEMWRSWGPLPVLPQRIIHGDLKVSNLLFEGDVATVVLDLDTMANSSLDIELGDAMRSWCNAGTEDDAAPSFDLGVYLAAMDGYFSSAGAWLTQVERASLPHATLRIALELSMRFAADTLNDNYFGWNEQKFASRSEHNLVRARNQLGLARDIALKLPMITKEIA